MHDVETRVGDHSLSTWRPVYTMIQVTRKQAAPERNPSLVSSQVPPYSASSMP